MQNFAQERDCFALSREGLSREVTRKEKNMESVGFQEISSFKKNREVRVHAKPVLMKSDLASSDVGIFVLLTIVLILIGRVMGAWILSDQVRIQKSPDQFVSRAEEYQRLHNQCGPNSFFRLY